MSAGPGGRDDDRDNPGAPRVGYNDKDRPDGGKHRTLYDNDNDSHISWDDDRDGDYRPGTGHEDRDGRKINDWDRDRPGGR
jgi:hypothetical protein